MQPICKFEFNTRDMVSRYPAQIKNANKEVVFAISSPRGAVHSGAITFSRWHPVPLPDTVMRDNEGPVLEQRTEFFTYDVPPEGRTDWYLNFAHHDLFSFYGGALFAQDEMQVAEHPALASLRHALIESGARPLCVENGLPTPALIMGVERRCAIATDPNPDEGRPLGLYGNSFASGSKEAIRQATKAFESPTKSNILAIEAPAYGNGRYTRREIDFILSTVVTGFSAAVHESKKGSNPAAARESKKGSTPAAMHESKKGSTLSATRVAIHTGFWGCGAYGGNRVLMPLLQMVAAAIAGVDVLVFHSGTDSDRYVDARRTFEKLLPAGRQVSCDEVVSRIERMNFEWGVGDGN